MPLWTPSSARTETQRYKCEVCGAPFAEGQFSRYARHVDQCAVKYEDEIQADAAVIEDEPLTQYDKEAFRWGRKRAAQGKRGFKGGYPT